MIKRFLQPLIRWRLKGWPSKFFYLETGDLVDIQVVNGRVEYQVYDKGAKNVERPLTSIQLEVLTETVARKYQFYAEILEQPMIIRNLVHDYLQGNFTKRNKLSGIDLSKKERIHLVGCGSSYYAAQLIAMWFEEITGLPASVSIASEFRYQTTIKQDKTLYIFITQSGETADTLMALRKVKQKRLGKALVITNVEAQHMAREADGAVYMRAGAEIGVASTKNFYCFFGLWFKLGLNYCQ